MPGHHHLLRVPKRQEEEYYGSIDGVKPRDHPETYGYLLELRCVAPSKNQIYQCKPDSYKICSSCFLKVPEEYQREYIVVPPHSLVHKNSVENQMNCTRCYKTIVKVRPAEECRGCIEEYFSVDKAYLEEGWGAPVLAQ